MLSKKVCKACYVKTWSDVIKAESDDTDVQCWEEGTEKHWRNGYMSCFHSGVKGRNRVLTRINTKDEPPDDCPFYLEHLMEMQKRKC